MTDFKNANELLKLCRLEGLKISGVMKRRECDLGEICVEQAVGRMRKVLEVMRQSAVTPLKSPVKSMGGLIGGEAQKLEVYQDRKSTRLNSSH